MPRNLFRFLAVSLVSGYLFTLQAFSLLGPYATWQTLVVGYQGGNDVGGPMNINEGYRWPIPVVTYAYDATFLKYYGSNGVASIEAAIKVFNDLADVSAMSEDLSEYPLDIYRSNPTANGLGIFDIKSHAMSRIMEQVYGAAAPERYVHTLYSTVIAPAGEPIRDFTVFQRNFDPITWDASEYVNNTLYNYTIVYWDTAPYFIAQNSAVDPLAPALTTVAGFRGYNNAVALGTRERIRVSPGSFFPGLTRDDVGQIRFQLRKNNLNVETLFADVLNGISVSSGSGSGGYGDSPWNLAIPVTNLTTVNGLLSNGVPAVVTALRPGVGKYKFVQVKYDSLIGGTLSPYAINWKDQYVTNGVTKSVAVSRLVTHPDLLFSSGDYGQDDVGEPIISSHSSTGNWVNNQALNSDGAAGEHDGPGVVAGLRELGFGNSGRYYYHLAVTAPVSQANARIGITFGSFDGSTNLPIVYPVGNSIRAIENLALTGK